MTKCTKTNTLCI